MQIVSVEPKKTTQLFWALIVLLVAVVALTGRQTDPGIAATGVLLVIVSVFPFYLWLLGWSHGLPLWPVFALANGVGSALPMLQDLDTLHEFTAAETMAGGMTTVGFVLLGTIIWLSMTSRSPVPPRQVLAINQVHAVRYLLLFVALGVLFNSGILRLPGNLMQISRGISMSLNIMGLFVLCFYHGQGLLDRRSFVLMLVGLLATVSLGLTSLMLAQAVVPVAMAMLGYMLGSGKFPWRVAAVVFVVSALLHPGKYEMRNRYWGGEATGTLSLQTLPAFYGEWFSYGLEEVGGLTGVTRVRTEDESASSVFERGGNLHMLLLVQKKSPQEVPFLDGATYAPIPRLLIPRFIDDAKGISHAGNVMLSVNYGVLTLEGAQTTSVGWGLIAEAYANYGYLGVAGLAIFLGMFYALFTRITVGVPMTCLRFVLGLLVLAAATKADTMGIFITSQFQGIMGVTLAAIVLMRRQENPFATSEAHALPQLEGRPFGGGKEITKSSRDQGTKRPTEEWRQVGPAKWGGYKPPKWAPLSHRKAYELAAARRKAETATGAADEKSTDEVKAEKPRQVAVPIQPYYYRSRKV